MEYKIQYIGGAHMITLPLEFIQELGWVKGDKVTVTHDKETHTLKLSNFKRYMKLKESDTRQEKISQQPSSLFYRV